MAKLAQCKKCGSQRVAWVLSKKTGKWYLAFATKSHAVVNYTAVGGPASSGGGVNVYAHQPHCCDNRQLGGHDACPHCNRHHILNDYGRDDAQHAYCDRYPDAPQAS